MKIDLPTFKRKTITVGQLLLAIQTLAEHHTGREVLKDLLNLLQNKGRNLDFCNQDAFRTLVEAAFVNLAGSTVEEIKKALSKPL